MTENIGVATLIIVKKYFLLVFPVLVLSVFVALSRNVLAHSGPVGLNQVITDSGPAAGQVTLHWARYSPIVDNYRVFYGTKPGNYAYSTADVGNNVVETIGALQPGLRYYFLVQGYSQGTALPLVSPEVSEVAASSQTTVTATAGPYGGRQLSAVSGPASGQVTLKWQSLLAATNNFSIVYGTQPGAYTYGALNIAQGVTPGTWVTYTVGFLNPGTRYYFAVVPMQNGNGIYFTGEVSQVAR